MLAFAVSNDAWYLPAGLRFTALWLSPMRRWPWLFVADFAALVTLAIMDEQAEHWGALALSTVVPWWTHAFAIRVLRSGDIYAAPETPGRMASALAAMTFAALLNAGAQGSAAVLEGSTPALQWGEVAFHHWIGNLIGILVLAPLAFQFLPLRAPGVARGGMLLELSLSLLPAVGLLLASRAWNTHAADYASVVGLAPLFWMAFRHGWRGAAWALTAISACVQLARLWIDLPAAVEAMQLFVALVGSIALTLGAAIGALRRVNAALIERNRQEKDVNARLAAQAAELRDLSQRLVRAREDEQRRLAHELHDELGQSVTALGARLSLFARTHDDPALVEAVRAQRELIQGIQATLREVLQGLRPALLDRFGLEAALREGPIQSLCSVAGLRYELRLLGPLARLGSDASSAIYRICQEAATNCVRHANATRFEIKVDVAEAWGGSLEVHLRIEDDGNGFDPQRQDQTRGGLRGIRDRVLALSGEHRCETGLLGTRHSVWFVDRQPRAEIQRETAL